jgi:hypothetical protein
MPQPPATSSCSATAPSPTHPAMAAMSSPARLAPRLALLLVALPACTSSSPGHSNGVSCVQHGATITCGGTVLASCSGGLPEDPAMPTGACSPDASAPCAGCHGPAGYSCSCNAYAPAGDAGGSWLCVGTGGPCQ